MLTQDRGYFVVFDPRREVISGVRGEVESECKGMFQWRSCVEANSPPVFTQLAVTFDAPLSAAPLSTAHPVWPSPMPTTGNASGES